MPSPTAKVLTVGSLVAADKGVNLVCKCGHRTALLPTQIAAMAHPSTSILNLKRRFRCSMCGRPGASNEIRATTFEVAPALRGSDPQSNVPRVRH